MWIYYVFVFSVECHIDISFTIVYCIENFHYRSLDFYLLYMKISTFQITQLKG